MFAPEAICLEDEREKCHGVKSDKALPALGADADKVDSKSVKFWFRLACAATKRNLRDSYPKASTEKQTISLLGEGHLLGLGDCEQCCT